MYFKYYGLLENQQNMLGDQVRTSTYHQAVMSNACDFKDKVVLDVGCGSGILSFFAAHAGAKRVYAVEASDMATYAEELVKHNGLDGVIRVVRGCVEDVLIDETVDVIISEPMGVFLLHERMMESFLLARDRFMNCQNGIESVQMWPSAAVVKVAPISCVSMYAQMAQRAEFWKNTDFYGVDLSALSVSAFKTRFSRAVISIVDPNCLLSTPSEHAIDFCKASVADLQNMTVALDFEMHSTGIMHGLVGWFDALFRGSAQSVVLSTSPSSDATHWHQVCFLFDDPIAVNRGQRLVGDLTITANDKRSVDVKFDVHLLGTNVQRLATYTLQDQQYPEYLVSDQSPEHFGVYPKRT